ncbi:MAG: hypothetical protein M3Z24_00185 [Chloroflexota bacterium]|nr:hypothetical protein [Chloroflexota bacterium]
MSNSEEKGSHIWLRYATQFQSNGRTHTVEIGIPVPIGASAETRERLIREAEDGLDQLSTHINGRVSNIMQRQQSGQKAPAAASSLPATGSVQPIQPVQPTQSAQSAQQDQQQVNKATSAPTPQMPRREEALPQSAQLKEEVSVPTLRTNIGTSMPSMLDTSSTLNIPQFLQIIKEALNLDARQAMDLLQVKALSGLNLRDALEQLQQLVQSPKSVAGTSSPQSQKSQQESAAPAEKKQPSRPPTPAPVQAQEAPNFPPSLASNKTNQKKPPFEEITGAVVRDRGSAYAFDEEVDLENLDIPDEDEREYPEELTDSERQIAEDVLARLKDARGSSMASPARLTVLNNVISGQLSTEQLQQIIEGIWSVATVKKLKNDQVEELIRWAKMDDFEGEAELVLALLDEEQYASSDR